MEIGPAIEEIYNRIFTLAVQGISQDDLNHFMRLFSRISENFASEQADE